jgi:hypothetical protein
MTNAARAAARSSFFGRSFPQGPEVVNPRARAGQITLLNVKPTVGFTLPWAGVILHPMLVGAAKRGLFVLPLRRALLDECRRPLDAIRAAEDHAERFLFEAQSRVFFHRECGSQSGLRLAQGES